MEEDKEKFDDQVKEEGKDTEEIKQEENKIEGEEVAKEVKEEEAKGEEGRKSLEEDKEEVKEKKVEPQKKHQKRRLKTRVWKSLTLLLAVLLVISILTNGFNFNQGLSKEEAAGKALNFFNTNLLQGQAVAELEGITEEEGLYNLKLNIRGREIDSYITKDGELLFPQGVKLKEVEPRRQRPEPEQEGQQQASEITKSDKPEVELFVMSFCPFGNKAEDTMYPVYELLKDKVDWQIHYIVSIQGRQIRSLHGQPETDQNIREVCVKRNYGMNAFWKFMTYVNQKCGSDGSCWREAAKKAGADVNKIKECFDKDGFNLMKAEAEATGQAGATGSPTMLINGAKSSVVYQYGNSESYKQIICSAFTEAPEECSEALGASTATSQGGSC